MKEVIVLREELIELFEKHEIIDTEHGWFMEGNEIDIVALHELDPKFLHDITKAKSYKIISKGKK